MQCNLPQDRPMKKGSSDDTAAKANFQPLFTRNVSFSGSFPGLGNESSMKIENRDSQFFKSKSNESTPSMSSLLRRDLESSFSSRRTIHHQAKAQDRGGARNCTPDFYSMSMAKSRYPIASPVPSLVCSEYSASPSNFSDWNSPSISRGNSLQSLYGTPSADMRNDFDAEYKTPFASPPPSRNHSAYFFTPSYDPVFEEAPDFPLFESSEAEVPASSNTSYFSPKPRRASLLQCTTPLAESKIPEPTKAHGNGSSASANNLLCTPRPFERSYLSTAMRGKDASGTPKSRNSSSPKISTSRSPTLHRSQQTNVSVDLSGSPLPQNLKGDPHRQAKVKTELCLFFSRGKPCPFGRKCNYAHGEHELKYTTLMEMDKAGLVSDVDAYRAFPCLSWVSTGGCPFGLRCTNIHDPRVKGSETSWLPHCDIPASNLPTDLIVDKSHHLNLAELSQKNSLVQNQLWNNRPSLKKNPEPVEEDDGLEWRDTYSLVCNLANLNPRKGRANVLAKTKISELQRLSIASHMGYGTDPKKQFVYKPQHLVYNEICMVIRTEYFCLLKPEDMAGSLSTRGSPPIDRMAKGISKEDYDAAKMMYNDNTAFKRDEVTVVQELAFGLCGEPASRVSLWFDLANNEMTELSPQEVKKLKRCKQRSKGATDGSQIMCYPGSEWANMDSAQETRHSSSRIMVSSSFAQETRHSSSRVMVSSSFDTHPHRPFFRVEPVINDTIAVSLIQSILNHRITVLLQREYRAYSGEETVVKQFIAAQDTENKAFFRNINNSANAWEWAVTKDRQHVNEETSVPKTLTNYTPSSPSHVTPIWNGFLHEMKRSDEKNTSKRLPVFKKFHGSERSIGGNATMPHINNATKNSSGDENLESFYTNWEPVSKFYSNKNY